MEPSRSPGEPQDPPAPGRRDRRRVVGAVVGGTIVAAVIALLVVGLVNRDVGTSIQDALARGERPEAPDLELPVLVAGDGVGPVGSRVSLRSLRGRTVVVNLWASWCEPCEAEAPILERVAARYRGSREAVVVGINVQDVSSDAMRFTRANRLTYPTLRDGTDATMRAFEVARLPESFVIDPSGRIALHVIGQITDEEQITTAIGQL